MQLLAVALVWCAGLAGARPQSGSGYDYSAPQDGGVTGAFDGLRRAVGRTSTEAGRVPAFQQQLTSRETGLQRLSQERGQFQQGITAPRLGSQERGLGQRAGYESSAELQIGLRQPGAGGSFLPETGRSQQPTLSAQGSFESTRGAPGRPQVDFGGRESAVGPSQPGLPSSEILPPGLVQDIDSDVRSNEGSFSPQQVASGPALGFATPQQQQRTGQLSPQQGLGLTTPQQQQRTGQLGPQQAFGLATQQQPGQFGAGAASPAQPGVPSTNFEGQAQQPGQAARPGGFTGAPRSQAFGDLQAAPGQDFQGAAGRGTPAESHSGPAQYNFKWDVNDAESGNFYGHQEERDGSLTRGRYYVTLPDTRVMTVEYYADETGYHPTVTFEGEAQQFIPPPRQAVAAGAPAPGTAFENQIPEEQFQRPTSAGFPGFPGVQAQPQSLRGIGAQGQAQAAQQFAPQTPEIGQLGRPQGVATGVAPQQGLGGPQLQTTSAPGFSQTLEQTFRRPTQSPVSQSSPREQLFGGQQQPGQESPLQFGSSLSQQPGFSQIQQGIPGGGPPQAGTQDRGIQPLQSEAFAGQPQGQNFGTRTPLSSGTGSQVSGFSPTERGEQPGFRPSQRVAGPPSQGAQQPGQLYETPQQGSTSPQQQLVARVNGFLPQSGETFAQTNFGANQQPAVHSSGELVGFQGPRSSQEFRQQPTVGFGLQSSQEIVQQPTQGLTQQSPQGFTQQPSQGFTQQPSQGFTQQPSQGFTQQPSQGFTQQPSQGFTQQPSQGFTQQPSQGFTQQLSQGFTQQPSQGFTQQPSQGFTQQPSQGFTQQPSEGFTQQPTQGFTQQPFQGFTQQPSQGLTQQPVQGFRQQSPQGSGPASTPARSQQVVPGGGQPAPDNQGTRLQAQSPLQEQSGPTFQPRTSPGLDSSPASGRPVPRRPTQLYGTPQL